MDEPTEWKKTWNFNNVLLSPYLFLSGYKSPAYSNGIQYISM